MNPIQCLLRHSQPKKKSQKAEPPRCPALRTGDGRYVCQGNHIKFNATSRFLSFTLISMGTINMHCLLPSPPTQAAQHFYCCTLSYTVLCVSSTDAIGKEVKHYKTENRLLETNMILGICLIAHAGGHTNNKKVQRSSLWKL